VLPAIVSPSKRAKKRQQMVVISLKDREIVNLDHLRMNRLKILRQLSLAIIEEPHLGLEL
jgi:hypothetical protein